MRHELNAENYLLTPVEVATLFRVHPRSLVRWELAGKINPIRTPGGTRRYRYLEVRALYEAGGGVWPEA